MNLPKLSRLQEIMLFILISLLVLSVLAVGSYVTYGDVRFIINLLKSYTPLFSLVILIIAVAGIVQKRALDRLDALLGDFARSNSLGFVPQEYSVFENPGVSGKVHGNYRGFNVSICGNFHGYQLGRKSFVVEVAGVKSPSKLLFANNRHKFPKMDFWNAGKIPSFSSFLCERGPLVKLKNAYVLELPPGLSGTHYLAAERKEAVSAMAGGRMFDVLAGLEGVVYLDGDKLYYGQGNLPHSKDELKEIMGSLVSFASKVT